MVYLKKKKSEKEIFDDDYAIFLSDFLHKCIYCGYSFELYRQFDAIQMSTHNIYLYKEVDKKYTGCNLKSLFHNLNLKTTELLDCAFIGVCEVITGRSNTLCAY